MLIGMLVVLGGATEEKTADGGERQKETSNLIINTHTNGACGGAACASGYGGACKEGFPTCSSGKGPCPIWTRACCDCCDTCA